MNVFKIFPQHLFLSNYVCDYSIFQWANLSMCETGASSERFTTFVIPKYDHIMGLILNEAVKSLQIVLCITNTHIFKNTYLLGSNLIAYLLVFQGRLVQISAVYLAELFLFYNFVFTIGPVIYLFLARPDLFIEGDLCRYSLSYL